MKEASDKKSSLNPFVELKLMPKMILRDGESPRYILLFLILSLIFIISSNLKNSPEHEIKAYLYLKEGGDDVMNYLMKRGFKVDRLENSLLLTGTLTDFENTFKIRKENGRFYYSIPSELKDKVFLLNFLESSSYHPLVEQTNNGLSPEEILKAYRIDMLHSEGYKGQGIKLAMVVAYGNPNAASDLNSFSQYFNLPPPNLKIIYVQNNVSSVIEKWALLTNLVLQWSHAIAPLAEQYLIVAKDDGASLEDAILYALSKDYDVILLPFGKDENSLNATLLNYISYNIRVASNRGTLVVAPVDDSGSNLALYPASDPFVLSVGGTTLYLNQTQYDHESSWISSAGSKSSFFKRPPWQSWLSESEGRAFPDISFVASNGFKVFYNGSLIHLRGNSAAASQVASLIALSFQIAKKRFENLNKMLYEIYSSNFYPRLFNDIIIGQRTSQGWDYATGIGSPRAHELIHFISEEFFRISLNYSNASYSPYVKLDQQKYYLPINLNLMRNITHTLEAQEILDVNGLQRFHFKAWSGSINSTERILNISINKDYNLKINYKIQYNVIVNSKYGNVTGSGWYDQGSNATIKLDRRIHMLSNYTRALFQGWRSEGLNGYSGNSTIFSIKVESWVIINAIWKIQHLIEFNITFLGSFSLWYDEGSKFNYTISNSHYVSDQERYFLKKWFVLFNRTQPFYLDPIYDNSNAKLSIEVKAPLIIESVLIKQYKLSLNSNIEQIKYLNALIGEGWYDEGTLAYYSAKALVYDNNNRTRYILVSLSLDGLKLNESFEGYIKMDKPHTLILNYKPQHYIQVYSDFYKAEGSGWYDQGSNATILVHNTVYYVRNDTRYLLKGFNISDYLELELDGRAYLKIKVERPLDIYAIWILQYYVYLHNFYGSTIGSGWYDANSIIEIKAIPEYIIFSNKTRLAFQYWSIKGARYEGNIIIVNSPIKAEAVYSFEHLVEIKLFNLQGKEVKGKLGFEFVDSSNRIYYFNETVWLRENERWILNKVSVDGYYFSPVNEVSFFLSSPLQIEVKLYMIDLKIIAKDLFGFPVKGLGIEIQSPNRTFRTFTNEEGIAFVENIDPRNTKIIYTDLLMKYELNVDESGIMNITLVSVSSLLIIFLISALIVIFVLIRRLIK